MKKYTYPLFSFIILLVFWQVGVTVFKVPTFMLPTPLAVTAVFLEEPLVLAQHTLVTLNESLLGLAVATVLAFFNAIMIDRWRFFRHTFYPILVVSQTIPVLVLGPLLSLWFGFGMAPKIILVVLMSYFPVVVSFADAMARIDPEKEILLQTMAASNWQIYRLLKIPEGLVGLFSGLKVGATYCVGGAVIGEWLSAESGLGYYMIRVKNGFQIDKVFAAILCIIMLSLVLNGFVFLCQRFYNYLLAKGVY